MIRAAGEGGAGMIHPAGADAVRPAEAGAEGRNIVPGAGQAMAHGTVTTQTAPTGGTPEGNGHPVAVSTDEAAGFDGRM